MEVLVIEKRSPAGSNLKKIRAHLNYLLQLLQASIKAQSFANQINLASW